MRTEGRLAAVGLVLFGGGRRARPSRARPAAPDPPRQGRASGIRFWLLAGLLAVAGAGLASPGRGTVLVPDAGGPEVPLYRGTYALLIGVSDYTRGWTDLESIPGELERVERVLRAQGFSVTLKLDSDARELEQAFEDFIRKYGFDTGNRLLFYFAGHGHTRETPQGTKGYLVPAGAPDPRADEKGFLRKALDMSQIIAWTRRIEAKHALFLFDSCFSGSVFKERKLPDRPRHITALTRAPVRQCITAGSAGEPVPAQSTFAEVFVDGLEHRLADLNEDGFVTGTELGYYIQSTVPEHLPQTPQFGKHPDYRLSRGDFVFAVGRPEKPARREKPTPVTAPPEPQPGEVWTEPVTGMEFAWVPGGCFQMGSDEDAEGAYVDETPLHLVCLAGFWLGRHEVTQGQWQRVMGSNPAFFPKGDDYPVEQVSWEDAQAFVARLNQQGRDGYYYRLPSEAEWEYACRGGGRDQTTYCGGEAVARLAWYSVNSDESTHLAGTKAANGLGLHDMSGNVWEWVQDCYADGYRGAPADGRARESGDCRRRVTRGGSWPDFPRYLRSASRNWNLADFRNTNVGFRLARTP